MRMAILIVLLLLITAPFRAYSGGRHPFMRAALSITPEIAHLMLELNRNNPDIIILDVRTSGEYEEDGHLRNSILLDYRSPEFNRTIDSMDKSKTYLIHCAIGIRSGRTFELMKSLGFRRVFDLAGGIVRWEKEGLPVVRGR